MPQNRAVRIAKDNQVPLNVARHNEASGGAQDAAIATAAAGARSCGKVVPPHYVTLCVDRIHKVLGFTHSCRCTRISSRLWIKVGQIVNLPGFSPVDVEQSTFLTVARRKPVGRAADRKRPSDTWLLRRVGNRLSARTDPFRPVQRNIRRRHQVLAGYAVQHHKVPIARRLSQQLARFAVHRLVEQNRRLDVVPVMRVVRRGLEVPFQLARIHIQRDNRCRPKIAACTATPRVYRIGVPGTPVDRVQRCVISPRQPRHAATMFGNGRVWPCLQLRITSPWRRVPPPLGLAVLRVHRE